MRPCSSKKSNICKVCGQNGDGGHFGAEACRACAAFFRRSVTMNKSYFCRNSGKCDIQKEIRCLCKFCRFKKCLNVGMKKSAVQGFEKRINNSHKNDYLTRFYETKSTETHIKSEASNMPLLNRIELNYLRLESIRLSIYGMEKEQMLKENKLKPITYKAATQVHINEMRLMAEFVNGAFPEIENIDPDQRKILYKNFALSFILLENGYRSAIRDRSDFIFLSNGDYIDTTRPDLFYSELCPKKLMDSNDAVRMFKPSFDIYRRSILEPMRREKVDKYEFFTLCSLTLWECGFEGQSDTCQNFCRTLRNLIIEELLIYYREVKYVFEPALRIANILLILPALQRSIHRLQEDVEVTRVFNSVEEKFYELVNGI